MKTNKNFDASTNPGCFFNDIMMVKKKTEKEYLEKRNKKK